MRPFSLTILVKAAIDGCSYLLASDGGTCTPWTVSRLTSWDRGYGDLAFKADFTTIRHVPWHEKSVIIFRRRRDHARRTVAPSPRQVLQQQVAGLAERGWHGLTGTELEFIVFDDSYEQAWKSGYRDLTPVNLYNVDIPCRAPPESNRYSVAFVARCAARHGG